MSHRTVTAVATLAALLSAHGAPALAAEGDAMPTVRIRNAAVRVVIVPEARADVVVRVVKANPRLPVFVGVTGDTTIVDGHLQTWFLRCRGHGRDFRVRTMDRGAFGYDDLPLVVIETPLDARVATGGLGAGGAVTGSVGRADALSLDLGACGDWTVANVRDRLSVAVGGSGDVSTGSAGSARLTISGSGRLRTRAIAGDLSARVSGSGEVEVAQAGHADLDVSGSGDMRLGPVTGGLRASISGSGDLKVERLAGDFDSTVSGVGDVKVSDGQVGAMRTHISGSGDVDFGGTAQSLEAVISGRGDVSVRTVTGNVDKRISGAGAVHIGP
ncbi:GIN domain-containing protein [Caulobacter sp. KR2-114]|uniref:GIN domain-containing protein n=1 Tax=Caulobacter sp. KR2-114 TaxID=3400912 RepID=UPI003C06E4A0